jgi:hypothetical protein
MIFAEKRATSFLCEQAPVTAVPQKQAQVT